jgi:hypothetical protein
MANLEKAFVAAVAEKRGIRGSVLPPDIRATARLLTLALEEAKLDYKRLMTMATTGRVADPDFSIFSNCGSGSSSGSRVLMTKIICFFLSKISIYLSLGLYTRTHRLQEKPSALKRDHPAIHKPRNFLTFFLFLWVIFAPPGSGCSNSNECGSRFQHFF